MASEDEEVAALDRVLTRTVLTKDDDLQQVREQGHAHLHRASMCVIASNIRYLY